jgi:replicative DNA helicase
MSYADIVAEHGMPASIESEKAILGSILQNAEHYHEAAEGLTREAFSLDSHRRIFQVMTAMARAGQEINLVTLVNELGRRKEVDAIGGAAYLASLSDGLLHKRSIGSYVEIVKEKAMLRQVTMLGQELATRAADQAEGAHDLIAEADRRLLDIAGESTTEWPNLKQQTIAETNLLHRQMAGDATRILTTGIAGFDMLAGGLAFREVAFLAARPGQGKTWLICQLLWRYCTRGIPCHFFTVEMAAGALLRRLWAMVSGVSYKKLREGAPLSPDEMRRVMEAAAEIAEWPLVLDDCSSIAIDQLIAKCRVSKRRHGTQFFALDYLQKMKFTREAQHRHIDVSDAAIGIARMTKEEDVVFLAVSSLTTKNGKGRNEPPTMSDFRQSGDIEYEASTVIFIHREVDPESEKLRQDGEMIVAKSRNAEQGAIRIQFNPGTLTFEEKAYAYR